MPSYEELKNELKSISEVVGLFPETVKPQVYDLLVQTFVKGSFVNLEEKVETEQLVQDKDLKTAETETGKSIKKNKRPPSKRSVSKENYKIDGNLNLRRDNVQSFKEFYQNKKPSSAIDFNVSAIYYLQEVMKIPQITLTHIYTCYDEVKKRPPIAFRQSFIDTKNKMGFIDFDPENNLVVNQKGKNFVQFDLPKKSKDNK